MHFRNYGLLLAKLAFCFAQASIGLAQLYKKVFHTDYIAGLNQSVICDTC
jgi:hypothetical protein